MSLANVRRLTPVIKKYFNLLRDFSERLQRFKGNRKPGVIIARVLIRIYKLVVSPIFGPACRFEPTCSHYAMIAIERYGVAGGGLMALKRLLRCHPWSAGGFDPVP